MTAYARCAHVSGATRLRARIAVVNFADAVAVSAGGGVIINIGSVSGSRANPGSAAYGAAKAGLVNLTQTLGLEFAPRVRVVCVTAGMVITEESHLFYGDEAGIAAVGATVPLGRMADPSDIADVCLFAASPLARYITGE